MKECKFTLVLYELESAKLDVIRWVESKGGENKNDQNIWYLEIDKGSYTECVSILPSTCLTKLEMDCDKLVLFGSFTKSDIIKINDGVNFIT